MGDEEGLRKRGLPIEELMQLQGGTGGLSSGPPASGLEYLMQVR